MIRNRYRGEPSRWHLLFLGLLLGLAIGLFIGWWLWPVRWTNSWPTDLSQAAKADYIAAVADAYVADGSAQAKNLADMRLNTMRENLPQEIMDAKVYFSNNGPNPNIRISNLDQLATGLGVTTATGNTVIDPNAAFPAPNQAGDVDSVTGNITAQTDTTQNGINVDTPSDVIVEGEGNSTLASWIPWLLTLLSGLLLLLGALYILYRLSNRRMREQGQHPNHSTPGGPPQQQPGPESYNEDFAPPQSYSDDEYDFNDDYHFEEEEIDEGQWRLTSGQVAQTQPVPEQQPPAHQQGGPSQRQRASLPSPRGQNQPASAHEPTNYEPDYEPPRQRQISAAQQPQQERFQRTAPAIAAAVSALPNVGGNRQTASRQTAAQQTAARPQTVAAYPDEEIFDDPFENADDVAFDEEAFDWADTDPGQTTILAPETLATEPESEQRRVQERAAPAPADDGLEALPEEYKSERFAARQNRSVEAPAAPTIDKAFLKQTQESSLVDKYVAHYHIGDHDYTQLYEIETEDGDHLGEVGVDIDGIYGILNQNPEYVTVLDVWLFDATGEDSLTQLLLSQHARQNGAGDTSRSDRRPLPASPGLRFQLEGSNLLLDCEVSEVNFLENNGPAGIFQSVTVEMAAYQKNG